MALDMGGRIYLSKNRYVFPGIASGLCDRSVRRGASESFEQAKRTKIITD